MLWLCIQLFCNRGGQILHRFGGPRNDVVLFLHRFGGPRNDVKTFCIVSDTSETKLTSRRGSPKRCTITNNRGGWIFQVDSHSTNCNNINLQSQEFTCCCNFWIHACQTSPTIQYLHNLYILNSFSPSAGVWCFATTSTIATCVHITSVLTFRTPPDRWFCNKQYITFHTNNIVQEIVVSERYMGSHTSYNPIHVYSSRLQVIKVVSDQIYTSTSKQQFWTLPCTPNFSKMHFSFFSQI